MLDYMYTACPVLSDGVLSYSNSLHSVSSTCNKLTRTRVSHLKVNAFELVPLT